MRLSNNSKLIFYGLGGAGQRHLRFLYKYFKQKINFLAYRTKNKVQVISKNFELTGKLLSDEYKSIIFFKSYKQSLIPKIDYAFICGPTSKNFLVTKDCIKKKRNIFVEKPFICSLNNFFLIKKKINKLNLKVLVGYQRRFHPLVIKLKKMLEKNNACKKKVFIKVNSYVPYWHKYEDFKNLYACKKSLGGGALFTESHEIDLCLYFFGMPEKIYCKKYFSRKIGIDVETSYYLKLFYKDVLVYLNVDMFSKNLKRTIKIFDKKYQYELDLLKDTLIKKYNNSYSFYSTKNSADIQFVSQLRYFFSSKFNLKKSLTQIENNLKLLLACKRSYQINRVVNLE
jgi:predicted dehydrogenase